MAIPYAPDLPIDKRGNAIQLPPNIPAKVTTVGTPTASSVVTFGSNTTFVEISAIAQPVAIKWGPNSVITAAGTANFDHLIQTGATRQFVIPRSVMGVNSIVGANVQNGLYATMAVKEQTSGATVAITEY